MSGQKWPCCCMPYMSSKLRGQQHPQQRSMKGPHQQEMAQDLEALMQYNMTNCGLPEDHLAQAQINLFLGRERWGKKARSELLINFMYHSCSICNISPLSWYLKVTGLFMTRHGTSNQPQLQHTCIKQSALAS